MQFERTIKTNGSGLWSDTAKDVRTTHFTVSGYRDSGGDVWGELRVYFDVKTWDTKKDGLIYTDDGFLDTLIHELNALGIYGMGASYSEQGMQGQDFVSLDVDGKFIASLPEGVAVIEEFTF